MEPNLWRLNSRRGDAEQPREAARVVSLGHAVLDRIYQIESLPCGPGKQRANAYREGGGGIAATAAVCVAALGGRSSWWGRLGGDPAGRQLRRMMVERGVDVPDAVVNVNGLSAHASICVDRYGDRSSVTFPGILPDDPAWLPLAGLADVGAVLVDHRWIEGAERLLAAAVSRNIPRVLDADLGAPDVVRQLVPLANHAIFAREALVGFTGHEDPEAGLRAVPREKNDVVAVTLGERGSLFRTRGEIYHVPTLAISASDTTGAGDVFHGAYTLALAEGAEILDAARFATAAAALKAINGRSWDGMPDRQSVVNLLKEKW